MMITSIKLEISNENFLLFSTHVDMIVTAETCVTLLTVAAQCHGIPKIPQTVLHRHNNTISQCNPFPFFKPRSALPTINSEICVSMKIKMKTRKAGMTQANGNQDSTGPHGINHPRRSGSEGEMPSGTLSLSVKTCGSEKSSITKMKIEIGTPKSPVFFKKIEMDHLGFFISTSHKNNSHLKHVERFYQETWNF